MASADLLLHPVRLRIIQAFLGDRALTTTQLAAEIDDIPPGSLYRHVALLAKADVIRVVAERRVRGAMERTYTMALAAAQLSPTEVKNMSPDQHRHAFMAFVAGLLGDFDRYLNAGTPDLARDMAGYRLAALWLSDEELAEFLRDLGTVIQPRLANAPRKGRSRRVVAGVLLPTPEQNQSQNPTSSPVARRARPR